jgi:hypothetical protein
MEGQVSRGCVSWWWTLRVARLQPAAMEFAGSANVRERKGRVALFPHSHHRSGAHITHQANIHTKIQRRKEGKRTSSDKQTRRRRPAATATPPKNRTHRRKFTNEEEEQSTARRAKLPPQPRNSEGRTDPRSKQPRTDAQPLGLVDTYTTSR